MLKQCEHCKQSFSDKSRSKNALYCNATCSYDAMIIRTRDRRKETNKLWVDKNYERYRAKKNAARKKRYKTDVNFKLSIALRARLVDAVKKYKNGSAVKDLGCSIEELRKHLESKFQPGMDWSNWSRTGWHIDHIVPLTNFDLSDPEQLKKACHYTNLQPLWAKDNHSKSNFNSNIYILYGVNGCGKTYCAKQLEEHFDVIEYDTFKLQGSLNKINSNTIKPKLLVTPIRASWFSKEAIKFGLRPHIIGLIENLDIVRERIGLRGGKFNSTTIKRDKRIRSQVPSMTFYGTQDEVISWLKTQSNS